MKQSWFNTPPTEKSIKKSKIASIILFSIFAITLIGSIVVGAIFPRSERVEGIDETYFTSVFYADADEWFYSTEKNVVRLDKQNDVLENFPLAEEAEKQGVIIGQIKNTYAVPDSEYMWVIASKVKDESQGYVFKLKDHDGTLTIEEITHFDGVYMNMLAADGYVYLFTKKGKVITISRYDEEAIAAGPINKGALYHQVSENSQVKKFETIDITIRSVDVIDGYLYVLHKTGLIKMALDFSHNNYKFAYPEKKAEIYAQLEAEATKGGTTLDDDAIKALEEQAAKEACAALGLKSYNEKKDVAEVFQDSFDSEKYSFCEGSIPECESGICGGAYIAQEGKYYIISGDTRLYSINLTDIASRFECDVVDGIKLYAAPELEKSSMFYNRYSKKAYIVYDSINEISCIDFNNGASLEYTIELEFDLENIVQIGNNLYYFYQNVYQSGESGRPILAIVDIDKQLDIPVYTAVLTISIIVCLLSGALACLFALCWKKEGYIQKLKVLFKRVLKYKWVYISMIPSVILLVLFCYYPAVDSIRFSFFQYTDANPTMRWNNFSNYKLVFTTNVVEIFGNMFLFLAADLIISIGPPLVFAFFLMVMRNKKYSQLMRTLLFIPGVIPGIAGLLIWREGIFSNTGGVLHMICSLFTDNPHQFMVSTKTARFELLLIGFPYVGSYLIFYGGMMNISDSYYEAAELEGIGIWKRFFSIDIPLIMPQIKYIFIMNFISSVQNFGRVDTVAKGGAFGTMTPIQKIYDLIGNGDRGEASAYATLIFVFLFFATALNLRKNKKEVEV